MAAKSPHNKIRAILDAAQALFSEHGYENASIADIAQQANVAGGTIIYHFKSKENLLFILVRQILFNLYKEMRDSIAKRSRPEDRIRAYVRCFFHFLAERPDEHLVLLKTDPFKVLNLDTPPVSDLKFIFGQHRELIQIIIEEGVAEKVFFTQHYKETSAAIFSMLHGMGNFVLLDNSVPLDCLEREAMQFIFARLYRGGERTQRRLECEAT